ncbi:solute symporter family protein [Fuchsiella alkaliacetigena]|uniref:solute symporter family protein n=1 Tax=Fuchsiella alkaliacetigena TaxID=957042 RepID=UPI00200B01A6|nr:cation acetate symporter [Fuchsiella alkaliacetigena]MCK8825565.1 cation acetate symporter [Fuchsiella alkaliacetigena]
MEQQIPILAVILVAAMVIFSIGVTIFATRLTRTSSDYYIADAGVSVFQNASAITGNYLSAASFLGVAGATFIHGYDGVLYAYGFFIGFVLLLTFIASPLKKFGQYTIPDFVAARFHSKRGRVVGIICVIAISLFYSSAQMVGAGDVLNLLLGIPYTWGVIGSGVVITLYVAFGGMKGTTLNQVVQSWVLLSAMFILAALAFGRGAGYANILDSLAAAEGTFGLPGGLEETFNGASFTQPGQWIGFADTMSLLIGLCFGTAGLPHILARFYTNPTGEKAKWSVMVVLLLIGCFYILAPYVGNVGRYIMIEHGSNLTPRMAESLVEGGQNLVVPIMGDYYGGEALLGITIAGAVAAILATISGLLITLTSAVAHDLYTSLFNPDATEEEQVKTGKIVTILLGVSIIIIGLVAEGGQVAILVGLAFTVAASTFFPVLALGIWWKKATASGALWGMIVGLLSSNILIFFADAFPAWLQYENPAIISLPLAFIVNIVVSLVDGKIPADVNEFMELVHGPEDAAEEA